MCTRGAWNCTWTMGIWPPGERPGRRHPRRLTGDTSRCTSIMCCRRTRASISISWLGALDRRSLATITEETRMSRAAAMRYRGVFPVAPTVFHENGDLDLEGQKRATDFMIEAGSTGLCILANWSEQF